jgi:hypothetical protein
LISELGAVSAVVADAETVDEVTVKLAGVDGPLPPPPPPPQPPSEPHRRVARK